MNTFYTLLTTLGLAKLTNAQISQTKVNVSHVAVGDGNGAYYEPNENMVALRRETWRGGTSRVAVAEDNPNWIEIEVTVPANVGGFYIREVGVFDDAGTLIAIAKYPETYKPTVDFGSTKDLNIKIIIELNNTNSVEVKIDPHIITASRAYVDKKIAESIGNIGTDFTELEERVTTHLAESTAYKTIKLNKDSEGIFTTIEHRRKSDNTLISKSVLSGGISPLYSTRSVTYYEANGTTAKNTYTYALTYDADSVLVSEV